tara:strand:+ start:2162 stop:2371 length:210 start_codon:yes stop_codon:yes gene_type:complete
MSNPIKRINHIGIMKPEDRTEKDLQDFQSALITMAKLAGLNVSVKYDTNKERKQMQPSGVNPNCEVCDD